MITAIKKNKWIIILISFIVLNIGWMVYSNNVNKDSIQLENSSHSLALEVDEENREEINQEKEVIQPIDVLDERYSIDQEKVTEPVEIVEVEEVKVEEVPVYICGEVRVPGVYYVSAYAIINEVVEKSGGFTDTADQTAINLASPIVANEKIIVPKIGEEIDKLADSYDNRERIESSSVSLQTSESQSMLINLNTATKEQLMTLNGIGEVKAMAILAYRQEKGIFNSIDEIKNISGIGEKTFEKIRQFITT